MPTIINGMTVPDELNIRVLQGRTVDITIPVLVIDTESPLTAPAAYDLTGHTLRCRVRSRYDGSLIADLVAEGWLTVSDASGGLIRLLIPAADSAALPTPGAHVAAETVYAWDCAALNPSGRVHALWQGLVYIRSEVST